MTVLNDTGCTVTINENMLNTDWATAKDDQIVASIRKIKQTLLQQTGCEPTHCGTPFGWFLLQPVKRVQKIKKGPGKYRTITVHFTRVK